MIDQFQGLLKTVGEEGQDDIRDVRNAESTQNLIGGNIDDIKQQQEAFRVTDREKRLEIAFLQSGKFKEALQSQLEWLNETQDLIANQKPPSADYKVAKAQLQEQKILQRMVDDRAQAVSSLLAMGEDIVKQSEGAEKDQIKSQLGDFVKQWERCEAGCW
ncbi:unnamed protein product [Owenia fusiformis]|uniref:Uncharacterized protein n=1 Tax=Owenia fusiformis TaxID=6347 RepID=A0A8S4QFZ7_OWEFU|nr:unnamed protein product [Owenia fusiformis]